jgi:hypothetical protein
MTTIQNSKLGVNRAKQITDLEQTQLRRVQLTAHDR